MPFLLTFALLSVALIGWGIAFASVMKASKTYYGALQRLYPEKWKAWRERERLIGRHLFGEPIRLELVEARDLFDRSIMTYQEKMDSNSGTPLESPTIQNSPDPELEKAKESFLYWRKQLLIRFAMAAVSLLLMIAIGHLTIT